MRAVINGQLVEVPEDATVGTLKSRIPNGGNNESLAKVSGARAELKNDSDPVEPGGKYRSIPPITQG